MKAQNAAYNAAGTSTLNAYADASGSTATGSGSGKKKRSTLPRSTICRNVPNCTWLATT
jgi:hypothetical protein